MSGFSSPNHTQTPNDLFDKHMADMGESELKVTLAIIRQTLGYHKKSDPISLTQLQKMTGLSRQGAFDGAQAAINRGLVEIVGTGKRGVLIYGLVIDSDQSTALTSEAVDQSTGFNSTGLPSRHTKETTQKKKKKESVKPSRLIFEAIAKGVFELTDLKGIKGGRFGQLETVAKRIAQAQLPGASDEYIAELVTKFARGEKFKPAIQGVNGFEAKFAAFIQHLPPRVIPSSPIIPLDPSLDDGTPATPEQIEQAKQMFADLLKKTKAV